MSAVERWAAEITVEHQGWHTVCRAAQAVVPQPDETRLTVPICRRPSPARSAGWSCGNARKRGEGGTTGFRYEDVPELRT